MSKKHSRITTVTAMITVTMMVLVGCDSGEVPKSTLSPQGEEKILTEDIIEENIIEEDRIYETIITEDIIEEEYR